MNALISVSDKTGIVELAQALHALGIRLISTGGTAKLLADQGLPVTEVAQVTEFPEMLDGRVKTLHPKVHGGLLARRELPEHMAALTAHGIDTIDLLVVNLYPFEATVAKAGCTLEDAIENIDIGGPAMVRSAAKNWKDVGRAHRRVPVSVRCCRNSRPDGKLSDQTVSPVGGGVQPHQQLRRSHQRLPLQLPGRRRSQPVPRAVQRPFVKLQDLRYGENPHQQAAFYRDLVSGARLAGDGAPAAGQGALVQQHRRRGCGLGMRQEFRRAGLRDRQARQPVRRGRWAPTHPRPMPRRSRPIPPRPSAASSRSTAPWMRRRRRPCPSSSSKC
jgi:hypothetical protein